MCRRTVARAELAGYFRAAPFCILVEARAVEARASARSHPDSFFLPTLRLRPAVLECRSVASCDSAWRARRRPSATQQTWNWVIIISLQSYFYYWYSVTHSLFHSRLKSFLFCKSSLPQPFLFLLQDSLYDFPDYLLLLLSISVFLLFSFFSVFTLF